MRLETKASGGLGIRVPITAAYEFLGFPPEDGASWSAPCKELLCAAAGATLGLGFSGNPREFLEMCADVWGGEEDDGGFSGREPPLNGAADDVGDDIVMKTN